MGRGAQEGLSDPAVTLALLLSELGLLVLFLSLTPELLLLAKAREELLSWRNLALTSPSHQGLPPTWLSS